MARIKTPSTGEELLYIAGGNTYPYNHFGKQFIILSCQIEHLHTLKPSTSTLGQVSRNKSCSSAPGDMSMNIHNSSEQMAKTQNEPEKPFNRRMDKYIGAS